MTKAIASYPESRRDAVVRRRMDGPARGLGYLAALDYNECKAAARRLAKRREKAYNTETAKASLATGFLRAKR